MPRKPKRPCSHPGCPNLCDGQYCEEHRVEERRKYDMTSTSAVLTSTRSTVMRGDVYATGTLRHILSAKCVSKQDG